MDFRFVQLTRVTYFFKFDDIKVRVRKSCNFYLFATEKVYLILVCPKNTGFTHKKQEKTLVPFTFWMLGARAL